LAEAKRAMQPQVIADRVGSVKVGEKLPALW
jgi:hypothetical protein